MLRYFSAPSGRLPRSLKSVVGFVVISAAFLAFASQALAQTEQDGQGRVEYDDGATNVGPADAPSPQEVETPRAAPVRNTPVRSKNGQPVVGRKAAEKYMAPKKLAKDDHHDERSDENHIMSVYLGSFVNDHAYKWGGNDAVKNVGTLNLGFSYRLAQWTNVADINGAVEYTTYSLRGKSVQKLSILPKLVLPDIASHFPLYFGIGGGLGIFTKQIHDESALSLDYTVFAGLRFLNIFPKTGFFAETGLKSHLLLLSDGQFNGWFISLGAIFAF